MDVNDYLVKLRESSQENYDASFNGLSEDEAYDASYIEDYLSNYAGVPRARAKSESIRIVKQPAMRASMKAKMQSAGLKGGFTPSNRNIAHGLKAQFNIQVVRNSANIATQLPVPIFGAFDVASFYNRVLTLTGGTTLTALTVGSVAAPNDVTFQYTNGVNVDTITVSIQEYPYTSFLAALRSSNFQLSGLRYAISDTTAAGLVQLSVSFGYQSNSMFGKQMIDRFPLSAAKTPYQNQTNIVDIDGQYEISAQTVWLLNVVPVANQTVTLSAFVSQIDKVTI